MGEGQKEKWGLQIWELGPHLQFASYAPGVWCRLPIPTTSELPCRYCDILTALDPHRTLWPDAC